MVHVRRNYRTPSSHFITNELGSYLCRNSRPERLAKVLVMQGVPQSLGTRLQIFRESLQLAILTDGDELHLRSHYPFASIMELSNATTGFGSKHSSITSIEIRQFARIALIKPLGVLVG